MEWILGWIFVLLFFGGLVILGSRYDAIVPEIEEQYQLYRNGKQLCSGSYRSIIDYINSKIGSTNASEYKWCDDEGNLWEEVAVLENNSEFHMELVIYEVNDSGVSIEKTRTYYDIYIS